MSASVLPHQSMVLPFSIQVTDIKNMKNKNANKMAAPNELAFWSKEMNNWAKQSTALTKSKYKVIEQKEGVKTFARLPSKCCLDLELI